MSPISRIAALIASAALCAGAQTAASGDPVVVQTDHPRLILRPARIKLLRRERERNSMRWQQFFLLVAGHAPMGEPGLALALYYQSSEDTGAAKEAITWVMGPNTDLRQEALVYDWCQDILTAAQKRDLAARLEKGLAAAPDDTVAGTRNRAFAAIALFDHSPQTPRRELERIVHTWWEGKIAPALNAGRDILSRDDAYPLMELLHVIRDSTNLDLRESARAYFKDLPIAHLLSYYPAAFPAPENDYYIGASATVPDEPDLRRASLSRAADMAMVAYDTNALETQMLQGWLMHDRFQLKSTFGAPYEFLWASPYQPGLSYFHAPLGWHNPESGTLFVRANWEESSPWFGDFGGVMQIFSDGRLTQIDPSRNRAPLLLEQAAVCFGKNTRKFQVTTDGGVVYIVGLDPNHTYEVEVDDEEMYEGTSDRGGILQVEVPTGREVGLRLK